MDYPLPYTHNLVRRRIFHFNENKYFFIQVFQKLRAILATNPSPNRKNFVRKRPVEAREKEENKNEIFIAGINFNKLETQDSLWYFLRLN